jgi:hypothetical protein
MVLGTVCKMQVRVKGFVSVQDVGGNQKAVCFLVTLGRACGVEAVDESGA